MQTAQQSQKYNSVLALPSFLIMLFLYQLFSQRQTTAQKNISIIAVVLVISGLFHGIPNDLNLRRVTLTQRKMSCEDKISKNTCVITCFLLRYSTTPAKRTVQHTRIVMKILFSSQTFFTWLKDAAAILHVSGCSGKEVHVFTLKLYQQSKSACCLA